MENESENIIKASVDLHPFLMYLWGAVEKKDKNHAANIILEILQKDSDVCNEMLDAFKFALDEKEKMPTITSFAKPKDHNLISSQFDA